MQREFLEHARYYVEESFPVECHRVYPAVCLRDPKTKRYLCSQVIPPTGTLFTIPTELDANFNGSERLPYKLLCIMRQLSAALRLSFGDVEPAFNTDLLYRTALNDPPFDLIRIPQIPGKLFLCRTLDVQPDHILPEVCFKFVRWMSADDIVKIRDGMDKVLFDYISLEYFEHCLHT